MRARGKTPGARFALPAAAALFAAPPLAAQELQGDPVAGYTFADRVCIYCHDIDRGGSGPSEKGAPAFQDVADDPAINPISLRVFLRSPHENMPDLVLTETQTDDIIAYIMGLK